MLRFIANNDRCKDVGGIALWQLMEEKQVLKGHSWESMKERFRRSILGTLDSFDFLSKEQKLQLGEGRSRVSSAVPPIPISSFASTTSSVAPVQFSAALVSTLTPALPSSVSSLLTHTPFPPYPVQCEDEFEELPDIPYVPLGGDQSRKRSGSDFPNPPARTLELEKVKAHT